MIHRCTQQTHYSYYPRCSCSPPIDLLMRVAGAVTIESQTLPVNMDIPLNCYDPLSFEVMTDPVHTPSGNTFEREHIHAWIQRFGTNPITGASLSISDLRDDIALKGTIQELLARGEDVHMDIERWARTLIELQRKVDENTFGSDHVLHRFICAMNRSIMVDPVVAADGHCYERRNIKLWIASRRRENLPLVSPVTREAMENDTLSDMPELKDEIRAHLLACMTQEDAGEVTHSSEVEAVSKLNKIFDVLDGLQDVLLSVLDGWEAPRVVVVGNQSHGKSTVLERLCMMVLFPRNKSICTRLPVKISIRRGRVQQPVTLETWDTHANDRIGNVKIIPLETGVIDIRDAMTEALSGFAGRLRTDRELRVCIVSPTLPPINLVDLPGTVEHPADLRTSTHALVNQYMSEHSADSMYLVVNRADSSPNSSGVMQHISENNTADRSIGVLTFCDKLDTGGVDYRLLRGWVHNAPDTPDNVPLEPHGYVAVMNAEPLNARGESNHARLVRQAQSEEPWFRGHGLGDLVDDNKAGAGALIGRINDMYIAHVFNAFVPDTMQRLLVERADCDAECDRLGQPSCIEQANECAALREAAQEVAQTLLEPCFARAHEAFATQILASVQSTLLEAIPENTSTCMRTFADALAEVRRAVLTACRGIDAMLSAHWETQTTEALANDALPFRLQRFPDYVDRLRTYCASVTPHLAPGTMDTVEAFVARALAIDSPWVTMDFSLGEYPAATTVQYRREQIVGTVVGLIARGYVEPTVDELTTTVSTTAQESFADGRFEVEACHGERRAWCERKRTIEAALWQLVTLRDQWVFRHDDTARAENEENITLDTAIVRSIWNTNVFDLEIAVNASVLSRETITVSCASDCPSLCTRGLSLSLSLDLNVNHEEVAMQIPLASLHDGMYALAPSVSTDEIRSLNRILRSDAERSRAVIVVVLDGRRMHAVNGISILGTGVTTLAGDGTPGDVDCDDGLYAQFRDPHGVAMDQNGSIYVPDENNHRIRKISANGAVSTIAGDGNAGHVDSDDVLHARFHYPCGVAADSAGVVYVADTSNDRIRKIVHAATN
eukprot:m.26379 g.26379  ORF g.26379 m.26379 type:complete len:1069 (+) comp13313_c0_seq3:164-3370(+)